MYQQMTPTPQLMMPRLLIRPTPQKTIQQLKTAPHQKPRPMMFRQMCRHQMQASRQQTRRRLMQRLKMSRLKMPLMTRRPMSMQRLQTIQRRTPPGIQPQTQTPHQQKNQLQPMKTTLQQMRRTGQRQIPRRTQWQRRQQRLN